MEQKYRYFKPVEFLKCTPKCTIADMDSDFLQKLDAVRASCGVVFRLNSAYRSPEYDRSKGRTGTGYHTFGRAVDIDCRNSVSRAKIVKACVEFGLSCGISKTFIHIDDRDFEDGYFEPIIFLY